MKFIFIVALLSLELSAIGCMPSKKNISKPTVAEGNACYTQVGIPTKILQQRSQPETLGRQRQDEWCWAASAQMILNYHYLPITQEQIAERAFGSQINAPGKARDLVHSLDGLQSIANGQAVRIRAKSIGLNFTAIEGDLKFQLPLIVALANDPPGTGNHARALTALSYKIDPISGDVQPGFVTMRNPWPFDESLEVMSWEEFAQRFIYLVQIRVEKI